MTSKFLSTDTFRFLYLLKMEPDRWLVFDKAYNVYRQFAKWTQSRVWFVTRMKDNVVFHVTMVMVDNTRKKDAEGVLKEQYVTVGVKTEGGWEDRLKLRRITYMTEEGRVYVFITNDSRPPDEWIAVIYRNRWVIELLFKQIKQNFPPRHFWGERSNAIKTRIYCVLMVELLLVVIGKKSETRKSFANMLTVIRLHPMSYVSLMEFVKDTYKAWQKAFDMQVALSP